MATILKIKMALDNYVVNYFYTNCHVFVEKLQFVNGVAPSSYTTVNWCNRPLPLSDIT